MSDEQRRPEGETSARVWPERYSLDHAAKVIAEFAGERYQTILDRLRDAVANKTLPVYEPNRNARYFSIIVREWYEQAYWSDLNGWLASAEPRIRWQFPEPSNDSEGREIGAELLANMQSEMAKNASFREYVCNGKFIDWDYWVKRMPTLSAAQASRLMTSLDPDIFDDLDSRPNKNDPNERCARARNIQRLAETEGLGRLSPPAWMQWATEREFDVDDGFRLAVQAVVFAGGASEHGEQTAQSGDDGAVGASNRYDPKMKAQERAILEALRKAGLDPMNLPPNLPGRSGVKSTVRQELAGRPNPLFKSTNSFESAWERLRVQPRQIRYESEK